MFGVVPSLLWSCFFACFEIHQQDIKHPLARFLFLNIVFDHPIEAMPFYWFAFDASIVGVDAFLHAMIYPSITLLSSG